jgi:tripartite-type tricarboxylate transporter receptor subunit TctC
MAPQFIRALCAAALLLAAAPQAPAQGFPNKPVRIVIGFPPGGGIDIVARIIAPKLSDALGQPVLVENRPGANGVVGMDSVAKAAPDGHTLLLGTLGNFSVNPSFYANLPFNADTAFAPLTQLASVAFILYANPALPVRSVADLIAYGRATPGKLNFSSSGSGGLPHLAGELFATAAGVGMVHVPYKGSAPSIADVMGGQVQITFEAAAIGLQHIRNGKLRGLATTGSTRLAFASEIPTVAETLPGFEVINWYGMAVPAGTPREVIARLHGELVKAMALPDVKEKMVAQGTDPVGSSPEAFGSFVKAESAKWTRVIRQANIRPD